MGNNLVRVIESEREKGTVEMNLSQRGIMDLPPEIGLLTNLKRLKLDGNQLTRIPFEITYLSNLQYLNLKSNSLKEFPEALCYMQRLEILDISKNQIKTLPEDFGRLQNTLKAFSISKNRLQEIPSYFSKIKELKILKLEFNPIEYPPPHIINCPPEMPQDKWLNRLKEFLKNDEKNDYAKIPDNDIKGRHSKNLESYIREAASINDCDILCDTYFHNVPRLTHDMDKLDPWVYYFVDSARNLIYAVAQLCRAIKQYSPAVTNPKIKELFEKEYGDVNRKVCQIIYSLDRFDRGMTEPSLHRRLCSDLKLIVMTTIPDVKKLLITIQSNLKLLMDSTNIRVSRNFLFTCHSVIVEVHAATESVLMAIPASERNSNPIPPTMTRSSSSASIPSLMNHKSNNSKSSMNSIINTMNAKSANTSSSSTIISTSVGIDNNENATNPIYHHSSKSLTDSHEIPINGSGLKASMSSSLNDLSSLPISTSQASNSSMKNLYQKSNSEVAEPLNIYGTSLTESFTGFDATDSGTGSYNESIKSLNIHQATTDNNNSNNNSNITNQTPFAISKQQPLSENTLHHPSQLSQQLNIETQIHPLPRKDSLTSLVTNSNINEGVSTVNHTNVNTVSDINANMPIEDSRNNPNSATVVTPTSIITPTQSNIDHETTNTRINGNESHISSNTIGTIERRIRHKSSLSASSSTAIVGGGNEVFMNNEIQPQQSQQSQQQQQQTLPSQIQNGSPSNIQIQTPQSTTIPMAGMNDMEMNINGNGINVKNNEDTVSVYSASSLPSAINMTIVPQPSVASTRLNNFKNLSLTYELKEFNYPLEEQFFILSFSSLRSSYACLELLKITFDSIKMPTFASENPEVYQFIVDCSGPHMENTRTIVDNYYEKFLTCVNYTVNGTPDTTLNDIHATSKNLIPIRNITLNNTAIINPNSTAEDHRLIYEDSIEYIHCLIQYTIIIREITQRITFNRNVIVSLQNVTKSAKNLVKFCSK
ncbi:hypothetical protein BCR36DRAFT_349474 [Piromyces finnis]|uniref:L domain-like protein n=1 Tax=Piromyces finnis TaxID=1754191 RepID=A0A1Y1VCR9_9FUNG|nr:hypothetical protein BCR36DRAFT_349474 [Piromyces finnis]|eukprot:ORX52879.1 hypothetical protein BCR36DRAFT_349474 [Piromyces finnis]